MSNTQISKPLELLNPGLLDKRQGPYATIVDACSAIKNVWKSIDGVLVNYRDGLVVLIGTEGAYEEHSWSGDFSDITLMPTAFNSATAIKIKFPDPQRIVGGINGTSGLASISSNLWRAKIDLTGVKKINFQRISSESGNGVAFFDKNNNFISGLTYPFSSIQYGSRIDYAIPVNAAYMMYSYATDAYAMIINAPLFDYFLIYVTSEYLLNENTKSNTRITTNETALANLMQIKKTFLLAERTSGAVRALDGVVVFSTNLFWVKVDLAGVSKVRFRVFTSESGNGIAFFNNNTFISGITYPLNSPIAYGSWLDIDVPQGATHMLYSYATDAYAASSSVPLFDYLALFVTSTYLINETNKTNSRIATNEIFIAEATTIKKTFSSSERVSGAVRASDGANVVSTNLWRVKIDLTGVSKINFQRFTSLNGNGVAFFDKNNVFISGLNYVDPIGYGSRIELIRPANAGYMMFSYATDVYATSINAPLFDYVSLSVTPDYLLNETSKVNTRVAATDTALANLTSINLPVTAAQRVTGGIVAATGADVASIDVWRFKIDLKGVNSVNFQRFTTASGKGVAFYTSNGDFISGLSFPTGTITPGTRATFPKPVNADYMMFSYLTDAYATAQGFPIFDYISLSVTFEYLLSSMGNGAGSTIVEQANLLKPWVVSTLPYGNVVFQPYEEKIATFEAVLEAYPAAVEKVFIGRDQGNADDMYAYIVTPPNYTTTIAITAHVHGGERINPSGFLATLS